MENIIKEYKERFGKEHSMRRRYACMLGVLALLVCLAVFWRLKLVGTAMTNEASCGLQEHTHTDACYTEELICGIATGETAEGADHVHTADCYSRELTCGLTEHTHTADCYSDPDADTETEDARMQSIPQDALTGDWAQDTVMIAASQMNYTESTRNWQLADDGTRRGYTRYGAWYGIPYGDWNGMFAAFCLHYAGVDNAYLTTDNAAGVNAWAVALYQAGQLQGTAHTAVPGDVVFLGSDDKIESCAIVADAADGTLTLIAGDVDNTVAELTLPADSSSILGYAATADAYAAYTADHPQDEQPEAEETAEDVPEDTEETAGDEDDSDPEENATPDYVTLEGSDTVTAVLSDGVNLLGTYTDTTGQQKYIRDLQASSVEYKADVDGKEGFLTTFQMRLVIPRTELMDADGKAYFEIDPSIQITDSMAEKGWIDYYDEGIRAGQYHFVKDEETGKWRVEMEFDNDYLNSEKQKNSELIYMQKFFFEAKVEQYTKDKDNKLEFKFSQDVACTVDPTVVKHPGNETWDYDITTTKDGKFSLADKKLYYTVTVSSTKGTPDPITVNDTLTIPEGVTVKKRKISKVVKSNGKPLTAGETASKDKATYKVSKDELNAFALELPGLDKDESYTITYEYELDELPANTSVDASNHLEAAAGDDSKGDKVVSTKNVTVKINSTILNKANGKVDKDKHTITWTIEVNDAHQDIATWPLTDEMLKQMTDDYKIEAWDENNNWSDVTNSSHYTLDKANGTITFNPVAENKNTNKYKITYKTPYSSQLDDTIKNEAHFGGQTDSGEAKVSGDFALTKNPDKDYMEASEDGKAVFSWTLTIGNETGTTTIPQDWVFEDSMLVDGGGDYPHYMTYEQAQEFIKALDATALKGHYSELQFVESGTTTRTPADQIQQGKHYCKIYFKVSSEVSVDEPITLKYTTTGDASNLDAGSTVKFRNYTAFSKDNRKKDASGGTVVFKPGAEKGAVDKNQITITDKNTTFMWYVQIWCAKDNAKHTYTVEDALPDGVELVGVGVGASKDKNNIASGRNQRFAFVDGKWKDVTIPNGPNTTDLKLIVDSGTQDGQKVTVSVTKPSTYTDDHFFVVFECKLSDATWNSVQDGGKATISFDNTATVTREDNRSWVTNPSTIQGTIDKEKTEQKVLTKDGNFTEWIGTKGRIEYTVKVNPDGKKLLEGTEGKELTLTDTMGKMDWPAVAELDRSSIQVFKVADDGTNVLLGGNEYTVDYEQSEMKLTITLPDQIPLVVKYTYVLTYVDSDKAFPRDFKVTNTAQLNGKSYNSVTDKEPVKWESSSSSAEMGHSYTIVKVDANNAAVCLPDAEFTVYAYNPNSKAFDTVVRTYRTDAKGIINLQWYLGTEPLSYNTAYCLQETTPPQGYELPSNQEKLYFYFGNSDSKKYPECMPDNFKTKQDIYSNVVDLEQKSKTVYVENERIYANASICKIWAEGTPEEQKQQSVKVDLMRIKVSKQDWEDFYNNAGNISDPVTLTVKAKNGDQTVKTYAKGATVHIQYKQSRDDNKVAWRAVSFFVNGVEVQTKQTGSQRKTNGYNGYDIYEADITLNEDTVLILSDSANWNTAEYILPASSGLGTSTWSAAAEERLADLLSSHTPERVTEGMEVYAGKDKALYNLPVKATSDPNSDRYIYYVKEQSVEGYTAALAMGGYGGSDSGYINYTFTITNTPTTPDTTYELPKTGGRGVVPYMAGGAVLMAVSLLCGLWKKRREGRRNS